MLERDGEFRLADEAGAVLLVLRQLGGEYLQRDDATQARLCGEVDHPHSASANLRLHEEVGDFRSWVDGRSGGTHGSEVWHDVTGLTRRQVAHRALDGLEVPGAPNSVPHRRSHFGRLDRHGRDGQRDRPAEWDLPLVDHRRRSRFARCQPSFRR